MSKTEVSREIKGNTIVVTYDNGSTETIRMELAPDDIQADAQPMDPCGHVFDEPGVS